MILKQLIKDTKSLEEKIDSLTKIYNAGREKIQNEFDEQNLKEIEVESDDFDDKVIVAKKVEKALIEYYADKLKEKLDSEVLNEIIIKTYMINDINGLISLLKNAGVNPQEFKKYVDVSQIVNKEAIKRLYSVGDITKEDIKGCYDAKIVKSISLKYKKKGDTD